jgi:hypothetical protein
VLRDETGKEVVSDKPGPPVLSVHADESGKTQRFLVVGSVWVIDVAREWRVVAALREWLDYSAEQKRHYGVTYPYELIDEIVREIGEWPDPVTLADLGKE